MQTARGPWGRGALHLCPRPHPHSLPLRHPSRCCAPSWLPLHLGHTLGLRGSPCPAAQPGQAALFTHCSCVAATWLGLWSHCLPSKRFFLQAPPREPSVPKGLGPSSLLGSSAPGLAPQGQEHILVAPSCGAGVQGGYHATPHLCTCEAGRLVSTLLSPTHWVVPALGPRKELSLGWALSACASPCPQRERKKVIGCHHCPLPDQVTKEGGCDQAEHSEPGGSSPPAVTPSQPQGLGP